MAERLLPGHGYVNETSADERLLPGYGYVNETVPTLSDLQAVSITATSVQPRITYAF